MSCCIVLPGQQGGWIPTDQLAEDSGWANKKLRLGKRGSMGMFVISNDHANEIQNWRIILWWTNIAMENHHFNGKMTTISTGPFSIAMLVHQRAKIIVIPSCQWYPMIMIVPNFFMIIPAIRSIPSIICVPRKSQNKSTYHESQWSEAPQLYSYPSYHSNSHFNSINHV